jgi:hypothetical protein
MKGKGSEGLDLLNFMIHQGMEGLFSIRLDFLPF